jgi:excisionase family DNA binding protein
MGSRDVSDLTRAIAALDQARDAMLADAIARMRPHMRVIDSGLSPRSQPGLDDANPDWLTLREAARYVRRSTTTLRRFVRDGTIRAYCFGGGLLFSRAELAESVRGEPPPPSTGPRRSRRVPSALPAPPSRAVTDEDERPRA